MYIVLLIILLTVAGIDVKTNKIPNRMIVYGITSGILCRIVRDGTFGLILSVSGIFVPSVFFLFLYGCKMIGAGDVKLMSVAGSFLGAFDCIKCLIPILVFTGGFSLVCYLLILFRERQNAFHKFHKIPMAVPIFLGIFWYLCRTSVSIA